MRLTGVVLAMVLALIALDACKPAKKSMRRARETHRVSSFHHR